MFTKGPWRRVWFYNKEIHFENLVIVFVLEFQEFRNAWVTELLWNENDFYSA